MSVEVVRHRFGLLAVTLFGMAFRHIHNRLYGMILVLFSVLAAKLCFDYFVKWFRQGIPDENPAAKGARSREGK